MMLHALLKNLKNENFNIIKIDPRHGRCVNGRALLLSSMIASKKTFLIVDDSEMDREIIRHWLKRNHPDSCKIIEVASSEAALELCEVSRIDCILLDLELPGMSGLEFLAELNGRHGKVCWPVLILTGFGTEQVAVEAMKLGALDFIVKGSLTGDTLHRAINQATENKRREFAREKEFDDMRAEIDALRSHQDELNIDLREKKEKIDRLSEQLLHQLQGDLHNAGAKLEKYSG